MRSKWTKAVLVVAGASGSLIGAPLLFIPKVFHGWSGIDLGGQVSLLSEVRAPGGALLACGLLILAGAVWARMTFTSLVVSTTLYLSYGVSRILSLALDGAPAPELVAAMVAELVLGAICAALLLSAPSSEPGAGRFSRSAGQAS
ncbi:DUF4345 domain-containing protein [Myxococcus qinghaiensis]|uniref:DUF4345 domain-containing protein n=1 Tax=Myxococcus qinghaiensis TaxID=2906758 RepID=UPI0020A70BFD|nr:DUF4345 domain-containing protein [Myxococcus qinghaiensis]MCP3166748.1 DUF4345 domain-containing protein [Myxococcus qinghaiensis]